MKLKPFIDLLRRTTKSQYKTMLMHERMLMQCYTVDEDEDMGFHYILHIPDTEEYVDDFYDKTLILNVKELLAAYTEGHKELLDRKKVVSAKPKEVNEELFFKNTNHKASIKYLFFVKDELVSVKEISLIYPVDDKVPDVVKITDAYTNMMSRVRVNGIGIAFDARRYSLLQLANSTSDIFFFKVKVGSKKLKVPIYKSMFFGKKEKDWDEFFISIQETTIQDVYLYTYHFTTKGITEQYVGYLMNY